MGNKRFPLFVDLTGRAAVVVGGGTVGLRRAGVLRSFGALVTVVSPSLSRDLEGIRHVARAYMPGDLAGAFLAVAATNDPAANSAVEEEARRLGIFCNRSDDPDRCDFFFPAVCEGNGLVAGLVGGGDHKKTARMAGEIRKILESSKDDA